MGSMIQFIDNPSAVSIQSSKKPHQMIQMPDFEFVSMLSTPEDWGRSFMHIQTLRTDRNLSGKGVRIGIMDCGRHEHPDIDQPIASVNLTACGDDLDHIGHSTHVAGILAGRDDSGGVIGVSPGVELFSCEVLDDCGRATWDIVQKGFEWCIQQRCDIINCSFGSDSRPPESMISLLASNQNTIVVAAAGNDSSSIIDNPAALPTSIAVGSCDPSGKTSSFSNFGNLLTIIAPGWNVYSTWLDGKYRTESGTSMACPMVSGVLALLIEGHRQEWDPNTPLIGYASAIEHMKMLGDGTQLLDLGWQGKF